MSRIGLTNLLIKNLIFHLDAVFLDAGLFENVSVGEFNFDGDDLSNLIPVDENGSKVTVGSTEFWQSPIRNWVYESNVIIPSGFLEPIVASGVTVNGGFKTRADGTFGHIIDYVGGTIVFDSPQLITNIIQAEFAFKQVRIKLPEENDELFLGRIFTLNPEIDKTIETIAGLAQELPLVLVEWNKHNTKGLQLGGGRIIDTRILIHVLTEKKDDWIKNEIADILLELDGSVFTMIDWNKTLDPLDFNGDFATGQEPFSFKVLQENTSLFFHKLYLEKSEPINIPNNFGISQAVSEINARTYLREF